VEVFELLARLPALAELGQLVLRLQSVTERERVNGRARHAQALCVVLVDLLWKRSDSGAPGGGLHARDPRRWG
jgi:hypothetical protein